MSLQAQTVETEHKNLQEVLKQAALVLLHLVEASLSTHN